MASEFPKAWVDAVARGLHSVICDKQGCLDLPDFNHRASLVLTELSEAGALVPPAADRGEEWGVRLTWDSGVAEVHPSPSKEHAEARYWLHRERYGHGGWRTSPTLIRRDTLSWSSPWQEVSDAD